MQIQHIKIFESYKCRLFLVYYNDYLGWIFPESTPEIWFQGTVFNLGESSRIHQEGYGESRWGKGRKSIKGVLWRPSWGCWNSVLREVLAYTGWHASQLPQEGSNLTGWSLLLVQWTLVSCPACPDPGEKLWGIKGQAFPESRLQRAGGGCGTAEKYGLALMAFVTIHPSHAMLCSVFPVTDSSRWYHHTHIRSIDKLSYGFLLQL